MSSFQRGHQYSNKLAEIVVTTDPLATTAWGVGTTLLRPSPAVSNQNFRVLEVGFTIVVAGTNDGTAGQGLNSFHVGTTGTATALVNGGDVPSGVGGILPAGSTISTSIGGARALTFNGAGVGNVDADGYPFLNAGEVLAVNHIANVTNGPTAVFFARLAPQIKRDVNA